MLTEKDLEALHPVLTRSARRYRCSAEDRQDIVACALGKVWRVRGRLESAQHRQFALRVLDRCHLDLIREQKNKSTVGLFDEGAVMAHGTLDGLAKVIALAHQSEMLEAVRQLPKKQRDTIILVCVEDSSYQEAAKALGCSVGTIRSRLHAARQTLRSLLVPALA